MPCPFCWCTLSPDCLKINLLISYLCKAVSLSPLATFYPLNLGLDSPFDRKLIWKTSTYLCSSLPASSTISPTHFVCPRTLSISTKLWNSSVMISAFGAFLPGNAFNLLLSGLNPKALLKHFSKLLPVIKWIQQEEVTWLEEWEVRSFEFLIWDPCYLAFWWAAFHFSFVNQSLSVTFTSNCFIADLSCMVSSKLSFKFQLKYNVLK